MQNYELLYTSLSKTEMSQTDLLKLLQTSKKYNLEHGITGCLIYKDRDFMQFLEGEKSAVEHLFHDRIFKDDRHHKIKIVWEGPTPEKSFENWTMAFENLSKNYIEDPNYQNLESDFSHLTESQADTTAKRLFVNFVKLIKKDFSKND